MPSRLVMTTNSAPLAARAASARPGSVRPGSSIAAASAIAGSAATVCATARARAP
jgi:hypothetical protein